ncbi:MAG: helix-turn-helix domain-containing protein [Chthoniobacterales bacterium]|nr:helix-turn-helix domain-containing protein [Chthoniobacterales bacterium]
MEGLGHKFQKARTARNLTLDEAARMTKIRPNKLAEIEAEDFSNFPSLAYAKGFVLIYGKFLNVDVSPYLGGFETSEHVTVDGYSYLQDNPAPKPRRTEVVRREPSGQKRSLLPLVIGVVVLVAGFTLLKLMMDLRRIKPSSSDRDAQALAEASAPPSVSDSSSRMVAPRALPADNTPATSAAAAMSPAQSAEPVAQPAATPTVAPSAIAAAPMPAATPAPAMPSTPRPAEAEPEVRRAEPVHPDDLKRAQAAVAAAASPSVNQFDIRPLRKTYVRVAVDNEAGGSFERWIDVSGGPIQLRGQRITVKVLNPGDLEIRKNGKIVSSRDADITMQ